MFKKLLFITALAVTVVSCQFTEIMVLEEDGSGRVSMEMDFSEMMAMGDSFGKDTTLVKLDTIVYMKDILEEKKDSISQLPKEQQQNLKKLKNFAFRTKMDPDTKKMFFNIGTEFTNVEQANELMNAVENSGAFMQGTGDDMKVGNDEDSEGVIAVNYSFKKGKFIRDAYIRDKAKHKTQMDSMSQAETFLSTITYKLKYTFPKKIKKVSVEDATFSLDGKTLEFERSMVDYMKDPDVMDLEVELEN